MISLNEPFHVERPSTSQNWMKILKRWETNRCSPPEHLDEKSPSSICRQRGEGCKKSDKILLDLYTQEYKQFCKSSLHIPFHKLEKLMLQRCHSIEEEDSVLSSSHIMFKSLTYKTWELNTTSPISRSVFCTDIQKPGNDSISTKITENESLYHLQTLSYSIFLGKFSTSNLFKNYFQSTYFSPTNSKFSNYSECINLSLFNFIS